MTTVADIAKSCPGAAVVGASDVDVRRATHDSREVQPGYLFAALSGSQTDGRKFVDDAIQKGAVALLVDKEIEVEIPQIVVRDPREALGKVAAACYGDPTAHLDVVGITGTNGKTTTAYLVEAALQAAGETPGVMSTVEYRIGSRSWHAKHTTPEAPVVQAMARKMVDAQATHLIMEASSHGLALGRLGGCRFRVVAFTNLTQDHLDFHRDMADYGATKLTLFTSAIADEPEARAVLNADDPFASEILKHVKHPAVTVSVEPDSPADIRPISAPKFTIDGIDTEVCTPRGNIQLVSPLLGPHNLSNLLMALGICSQLDVDLTAACRGLGDLEAVPGRLQRVDGGGRVAVLVDYAHTPDALERALKALGPLTTGRLVCVFGCGGDRDQSKRPLMGGAVARHADIAIVTSDNPRTENPAAIIAMIVPGVVDAGLAELDNALIAKAGTGYTVELDRRRAIQKAIRAAAPGDTVLIAGKGHEDYQILGTEKIHFDDREEAAAALNELRGGKSG